MSVGFFFQAEDGIRDHCVTGVQTCALPIYPVQRSHRLRRSGATIPDPRPPALWASKEDHIRQRHTLHIKIRIRTILPHGHPSEHQHCVPPPDRWSKRKNKPNARTISPHLLWNATEQLARLAAASTIYKEFMAIINNEKNPLRLTNRIHTPHPSTDQKN